MTDLASLNNTRRYVRQSVTKIHIKVTTNLPSISENERQTTIERMRNFQSELNTLNRQIFNLSITESTTEVDINKRIEDDESYDNKIVTALGLLQQQDVGSVPPTLPEVSNNLGYTNKLKLPDIPLPTYGNLEGESLEKFFHSFESIICKHRISSYEKFVYLKGQLDGSPRDLLNSLDVGDQSYEAGKDLLEKAFASKTAIVLYA